MNRVNTEKGKFIRHRTSRSSTFSEYFLDSFRKGSDFSSIEIEKNSAGLSQKLDDCDEVDYLAERKYLTNIKRLKEEVLIMKQQLEMAYEQINDLTYQINDINFKNSLQVQKINEQNTQKIIDLENRKNAARKEPKNKELREAILEKEKEILDQEKKCSDNILYLTEQYEKKIKFKENEHAFKVENLKSQFLDVVQEIKNKFLLEIEKMNSRGQEITAQGEKVLSEICDARGYCEDEVSSESSYQDFSLHQAQVSLEPSEDLDKSLRQFINQIGFEEEISMTDLISNK